MNNNPLNLCRLLLSEVRNGDFSHAGGSEAISIVVNHLQTLNPQWASGDNTGKRILDAGSGLGGTALDMSRLLSCPVWGIDRDEAAVHYAKTHYPEQHFVLGDILNAYALFPYAFFDLIYFFNVLYAIEDKVAALNCLASLGNENAELIIFDYVALAGSSSRLYDFSGNEMRALTKDAHFKQWLLSTGWQWMHEVDMTHRYIVWYDAFLKKMQVRKKELVEKFSLQAYEKVYDTFSAIRKKCQTQEWGGCLIYAKKRKGV